MSDFVPTNELMAASEQPEREYVRVLNPVIVANTILVICNMTNQEMRILAGKLAAYDAMMADEFAQMIIDAVYPPSDSTSEPSLPDDNELGYAKVIRHTDSSQASPTVPADVELWINN